MLYPHRNIEYDLTKGDKVPLCGIEEIIEWGNLDDWLRLRDYLLKNPEEIEGVIKIAQHRLKLEPSDGDFCFWLIFCQDLIKKNEIDLSKEERIKIDWDTIISNVDFNIAPDLDDLRNRLKFFYNVKTGIFCVKRNLTLETTTVTYRGKKITVPTLEEILRIKAYLIINRNSTRDYIEYIAIIKLLGMKKAIETMKNFENYYPSDEKTGISPIRQLLSQLACPIPYDLETTNLDNYKKLYPQLQSWENICKICQKFTIHLFAQFEKPMEDFISGKAN